MFKPRLIAFHSETPAVNRPVDYPAVVFVLHGFEEDSALLGHSTVDLGNPIVEEFYRCQSLLCLIESFLVPKTDTWQLNRVCGPPVEAQIGQFHAAMKICPLVRRLL
jgi:hypothetical protein